MSDTYSKGTVSIDAGTYVVSGRDTFFKTLGLVAAGSLITFDNAKYYRITEVTNDSQLRLADLISGDPYMEATLSDASYTVVKNFARQTNTDLMASLVDFRNQLMQEQHAFYNWVNATGETYAVPDGNGGTVDVLTPIGLTQRLNQQTYSWPTRYADDENGGGFSSNPDGKAYAGFATGKSTPTPSEDPADYTWMRTLGATGAPGGKGGKGNKGDNGTSSYFHLAYADSADGQTNFNLTDGTYTGTYVSGNPVSSSDPTHYQWRRTKGAQGPKGDKGIPGVGIDGRTSYFHVAYANSLDGRSGFNQIAGTYQGTYVDFTEQDSVDPTDYVWRKIKGDKGETGGIGRVGPGYYTIVNSTGSFPSDSQATADFRATFGNDPAKHDHLTYVNADKTNSTIKRYDGNAWVAPTLVVDGDALVKGTVTAEHIAAGAVTAELIDVGDLFAQNIEVTGAVKVSSGNNQVTLSGSNTLINAVASGDTVFRVQSNGDGAINGNWLLPSSVGKDSLSQDAIDFIVGQVGGSRAVTGGVRTKRISPISGGTYPLGTLQHGTAPVRINFTLSASANDNATLPPPKVDVDIKRNGTVIHSITATGEREEYTEGDQTFQSRTLTYLASFDDPNPPDNTALDYEMVLTIRSNNFPSQSAATFSISEEGTGSSGSEGGSSGEIAGDLTIGGDYIYFGDKQALRGNDEWLRINQGSYFTSGIYTGSSKIRTDEGYELGASGGEWRVNNSGMRTRVAAYFEGNVTLDNGGTLDFRSPVSVGAAVTVNVTTADWLRFRCGGTSDIEGIEISNYDSTGIRLSRGGNIDIYGSSPEIRFNVDGANDFAGIRSRASNGNNGELEFWVSDDYSEPFVWRSYDVGSVGTGSYREWMRLDNDGLTIDGDTNTAINVISNDNGESVINLHGSSQGTGRVYVGQDSGYGGGMEYNGDGAPNSSASLNDSISFFRRSNNDNHEVFYYRYSSDTVYFRGEIHVKDWVITSDKRVKDNIAVIPDALSKARQLRGCTFWHKLLGEEAVGLIADDMESAMSLGIKVDADGLKQIRGMAPVAILVEAVKELADEVDRLKEIING